MGPIVYALCGLTSLACAFLLSRQYRRTRGGLLLWSTMSFACLGLANIILFLDMVMLPESDLSVIRSGVMLIGMLMMLYGLIREST
jgi:hypothetical protein